MKASYGCIAKTLKHSYSVPIHEALTGEPYELVELSENEVETFLKNRPFTGINVTVPYKETVIPYLDELDGTAKEIGAVNTIVNRGGRLVGYNTDVDGLRTLLSKVGADLAGKRVFILGSGGTAKTARYVAAKEGASEIFTVSRSKEGALSYEDFYRQFEKGDILINTTPVGMYPNRGGMPIDPEKIPKPSFVIDAVYNPLRTALVVRAKEMHIPAIGGLAMLVYQARAAAEIMHGKEYRAEAAEAVLKNLGRETENIVLIGMPTSGKSSVGKELGKQMGRPFLDADKVFRRVTGKTPEEWITENGEESFREKEAELIGDLSAKTGVILATGGGAVLRRENMRALHENGRIYFLDKPFYLLAATGKRPLTSTPEDLARRYRERYGLYLYSMDRRIETKHSPFPAVHAIIEDFANESLHY